MARAFKPQIISANDLLLGDVVYFTGDLDWCRALNKAAIYHDADSANTALIKAESQAHIIVGAYLLDVEISQDGIPKPIHFRERFRERGPSIRPDLGRQSAPRPKQNLKVHMGSANV